MLLSGTFLLTTNPPLILTSAAPAILNRRTAAFVATAALRLSTRHYSLPPPDRIIMTALGASAAAASAEVEEVDIQSYLDSIEAEIRNLEGGPTLTKKLSEPNRKPMVRTLLGMTDKVAFDSAVRNTRREMEYERLATFVREELSPRLTDDVLLDDDKRAPDLPTIIETALSRPPSDGAGAFRHLGTGRSYQGNAEAMVRDLVPEVLGAYQDATAPLSEEDVMACVVEKRRGDEDSSVDEERIDAALRCLYDFPSPTTTNGSSSDGDGGDTSACCPKLNGRDCERACVAFLQRRRKSGQVVLENVYVNHKSSIGRPKYNRNRSGSGNGSGSGPSKSATSSGIIWTSVERENICSEFDAVVVNDDAGQVSEIWEAKFSVSPSTLWDAVTKKVAAVRQVLDDDEAVLSYDNRSIPTRRVEREGTDDDDDHGGGDAKKLTFGIFGLELLSPESCIDQLKSMAVANALSKDVGTVLQALECGFVEVDRDRLLHDIYTLREELRKTTNDFHISLNMGAASSSLS